MYNRVAMNTIFLRVIALILIISVITISASGCQSYQVSSSSNAGYKIFTIKQGIGKYLFEYNSKYKVTKVEIRNDNTHVYTRLDLSGPEIGDLRPSTSISVYCRKFESGAISYKDELERSLLSNSNLVNYNFLERFSVTVTGWSG